MIPVQIFDESVCTYHQSVCRVDDRVVADGHESDIHATAQKHIPCCESFNILEAVCHKNVYAFHIFNLLMYMSAMTIVVMVEEVVIVVFVIIKMILGIRVDIFVDIDTIDVTLKKHHVILVRDEIKCMAL